jgi:hypothetical protein
MEPAGLPAVNKRRKKTNTNQTQEKREAAKSNRSFLERMTEDEENA